MILDDQGNPIKQEPVVTATDNVIVPDVSADDVVVEPIVPVIDEVIVPNEAPVAPIDLGYPTDVAPEFVDVLKRFQDKGVKFDDVNLVLNDAIETGDINNLNNDALQSLVGDDAALIRLSLSGVLSNAQAQSNATMQALYDIAGGQSQYEKAQTFLSEASESNRAMIEAGLQSDNKALQQLAVEKLMANFKQSPNYEQKGNLRDGQNSADGLGDDNTSATEFVTQKELAEGLRKEMKSGAWDGTDANATPKVNELRRGFLALRKYRQARAA